MSRKRTGPVWCAWDEGYKAHNEGKTEGQNPFDWNCDAEKDDWEQWNMGWTDALMQKVEAMDV